MADGGLSCSCRRSERRLKEVRDFNQKTHSGATVLADYDCSGSVFVCVNTWTA